jgi:imidazoleglycerol-phosphate dehydratase
MRSAQFTRRTLETEISANLSLDGDGESTVSSGIGFFDHMLLLLARHAGLTLELKAEGDLQIDCHHTVEDIGIVIGQLIARAVGDKRGIRRYGEATVPMDEALVQSVIDFSGRPFLMFKATIRSERVGDLETQMVEEFFRAVAFNAGMTLHMICYYGENDHHIIEGLFKAFARSLRTALSIDPEHPDAILSTKGSL